MSAPRRDAARARGLTLLEVMVSIAILALVSTLVYGALDGMARSRNGIARIDERYQQGRSAVARLARELQTAFLSLHEPLVLAQSTRATAFVGKAGSPAARVDFTSFSHVRFGRDTHESDQNELGYFGSRDPSADKVDLVRREAKTIDLEPTKGGVVNVVAEDIDQFSLEYLDPVADQWVDHWDSTQAEQLMRLPLQVKITLSMKGGIGDKPLVFMTKTPVAMQSPLSFAAIQR